MLLQVQNDHFVDCLFVLMVNIPVNNFQSCQDISCLPVLNQWPLTPYKNCKNAINSCYLPKILFNLTMVLIVYAYKVFNFCFITHSTFQRACNTKVLRINSTSLYYLFYQTLYSGQLRFQRACNTKVLRINSPSLYYCFITHSSRFNQGFKELATLRC